MAPVRFACAFAFALAACRPAPAARPDAPGSSADCARDDVLVRGACVSPATAARYCGPAARWDEAEAACALRRCAEGQLRDRLTGACHGERDLRAMAERQHVQTDAEHVVGCAAGLDLRVVGDDARCVDPRLDPPRERPCARGQAWDGRACVALVRSGRVDVAAWARAAFGSDAEKREGETREAGPADRTSPRFCARASLDPAPFGLLSGASASWQVRVDVVVPDNDVAAAYARVTPIPAPAAGPLPSAGLARIVAAVDAEMELLRALSAQAATAEVAAVSQSLACAVRAGSAPLAVPVGD